MSISLRQQISRGVKQPQCCFLVLKKTCWVRLWQHNKETRLQGCNYYCRCARAVAINCCSAPSLLEQLQRVLQVTSQLCFPFAPWQSPPPSHPAAEWVLVLLPSRSINQFWSQRGQAWNVRNTEWLGLERILKIIFHSHRHGQGHFVLDQVIQSPI